MKIRKVIEEFMMITVGTVIVAAAVFFFMLPSHVSVGSGAALASAAVEMLNAYFTAEEIGSVILSENQLLP